MLSQALADVILVVHFAFVLFVALGGLLALRWPRVAWLHVPAAIWGVAIELSGWTCPLTPLENALRARGGEVPYAEGFIEHYLLPVVYPVGLTRSRQIFLGVAALVINVVVYVRVLRRLSSRHRDTRTPRTGRGSSGGR